MLYLAKIQEGHVLQNGWMARSIAKDKHIDVWLTTTWLNVQAWKSFLKTPYKLIFFFDLLLSLYLGGTPYPTISNSKLFGALKSGYRMEKPQMCSDEM